MNTTPHEASKCRRDVLLAIAVCVTLALPSLIFARAARVSSAGGDVSWQQDGKRPTEARNPRPVYRPSRLRRFGAEAVDYLSCRPANRRKRQELLSYGPNLHYDPNNFSIQALVGKGWPLMIEYEMETQSTVTVKVEVMNEVPFTQTFNGDGVGKIRSEVFVLPDFKAEGPQPARISFKAERRGGGGSPPPVFDLLAAGAGLNAITRAALTRLPAQVASLGGFPAVSTSNAVTIPRAVRYPRADRLNLYDVTFVERQGRYIYSFNVGHSFDRWGLQVFRHKGRLKPQKVREVLFEEAIGPYLNTIRNDWDGLNDRKRRVEAGRYKVLISVWDSSGDASWNIARRADFLDSSLIEIR